ncbi:hypothetical protein [Sphingopyxis sp. Geo48]|uniref:glycoside hydrolase family 130 protein n=1 Tax=Sphingopyxis sp. Geo48 TaxID=545241 RepID=UPI0024B7639A|nr:hypothetical protein [Sphingopyxis sp. Geo48]
MAAASSREEWRHIGWPNAGSRPLSGDSHAKLSSRIRSRAFGGVGGIGLRKLPLVQPAAAERHGYVPNVVYSCGAIKVGERILLPYAISDAFSTVATIRITNLLDQLKD